MSRCECESAGFCPRRQVQVYPLHWAKCQAGLCDDVDRLYAKNPLRHRNTTPRQSPGTELTKSLAWVEKIKPANATCSCKTLASEMDADGVAKCRQRRDAYYLPKMLENKTAITEAMRAEGGLLGVAGFVGGLVPDAIALPWLRSKFDAACDAAEQQPATRKPQVRRKSKNKTRGLSNEPLGEKYTVTPNKVNGMESRPLIELFDSVKCISLDRRPDRWRQFQSNLSSCYWPFKEPEKVSAIDGTLVPPPECWRISAGAWGCYRSHIRICEDALSSGVESILFMEDDAKPLKDFGKLVEEWMKHVPDNWQGLFFGGEHAMGGKSKAEKVNAYTLKCNYVTRTHCFGIRQPLLKQYYRFLVDFEMQQKNVSQHVDHAIARFMRTGNHAIYCPTDWMVAQAAATSDIFNRKEKERMFK